MSPFHWKDEYHCYTPEEMVELGKMFSTLNPPWLFALCGDLGTGKTTFVKGVALGLNCKDEVSSPTFAILHHYDGTFPLLHCDWYRIDSVSELDRLGWFELVDSYDRIVVEWADKFLNRLPSYALQLIFTIENQYHRVRVRKME